jgi:hypothetical protein
LDIIGHIAGNRKFGAQSQTNQSLLSDLLFNIPGNSLFVVGNSMPDGDKDLLEPEELARAANDYRLLFSALRNVLRQENLIDAPITTGEHLLLERYDAGNWGVYKERFLQLAKLSIGKTMKDGGDKRKFHRNASDVIQNMYVLDPIYAHFNLDPRHLQAILAGNYGNAKPDFDALIEMIAAAPEADENHRATAIQLFHRMKLLEFEFYKEQLTGEGKSDFDAYALKVIASMKQG